MRVADLKGSYDAIFSLGDLCLAAMKLEKFGLRNYLRSDRLDGDLQPIRREPPFKEPIRPFHGLQQPRR